MNGAPRMAPTPTSSAAVPPPACCWAMAMTGIIVSGSAVPTAARMLPVALSETPSRWPNHSTPLVNTSAPSRRRRNEPTSRIVFPTGSETNGSVTAGAGSMACPAVPPARS